MSTASSFPRGEPLPGGSLGGFRLVDVIAKGGFGVVFRAHREDDPGVHRAIKVLNRHRLDPDEVQAAVERLRREAQIPRHENLVRIDEFNYHGATVFLVMELLDGRDLQKMIADHPNGMALDEALRITKQAMAGLACLHENTPPIVHRDLKPANLFVTSDGRVKILDFGISLALDPQRTRLTVGQPPGTPHYYPPELLQRKPPSPASDVYAFGLVLYEMLSGAYAFDGDTLAVLHMQLNDELPDLRMLRPDVPDLLWQVIQRAAAKDPARRFASARHFQEAIDRALAGSPDTSRMATVPAPLPATPPVVARPPVVALPRIAAPSEDVSSLAMQLRGQNPFEVAQAARRLGGFGAEAIPHLRQALLDPTGEWYVRVAALEGLAQTSSPLAGRVIAVALDDPRPDVREAAARAMSDLGRNSDWPIVVDPLIHVECMSCITGEPSTSRLALHAIHGRLAIVNHGRLELTEVQRFDLVLAWSGDVLEIVDADSEFAEIWQSAARILGSTQRLGTDEQVVPELVLGHHLVLGDSTGRWSYSAKLPIAHLLSR